MLQRGRKSFASLAANGGKLRLTDDYPRSWDDRPPTRDQWERNKTLLMSGAATGFGWRPEGWWLYEKNMKPPENQHQSRVLYEMGELRGAELERCLSRWREDLEDGKLRDGVPPSIVKEWDAQDAR